MASSSGPRSVNRQDPDHGSEEDLGTEGLEPRRERTASSRPGDHDPLAEKGERLEPRQLRPPLDDHADNQESGGRTPRHCARSAIVPSVPSTTRWDGKVPDSRPPPVSHRLPT